MSRIQTPREHQMAELIVKVLNLEAVAPSDIDPDAPLFGAGLGLDSIDALELAVEIAKQYGVQLRSDDPDNKKIFASLAGLTEHVAAHATA
jgi:acyl carrier protein